MGSGAVSRRARKPWSGSKARSGRAMKRERSSKVTLARPLLRLRKYMLPITLDSGTIHDKSNLQQSIRKHIMRNQYNE